MSKIWKQVVSIFAICLLFTQTIFGSISVLAETNGGAQPILNIIMTTDGQPYKEGDIATSPVTIQVTTSSADSASIQLELSKDKGDSWEELDSVTLLVLAEEGDYHLWFRIKGQPAISKHHVRIVPQLAVLAVSHPIYVNAASTGSNDGTSWGDAFKDLQLALNAAQTGDEIWIAAGTYTPTKRIFTNDPRSATFQMKNGVAIYGGFQGTETKFTERNVQANPTILDGLGDIYHVFYHPNGLKLDSSAVLDGLTITGGNANGSMEHAYGGGMYNWSSSPRVTNVTFSENKANIGGGIYNDYVSSPTITNVVFSENEADTGGGMHNNNYSSPTITNVVFNKNEVSHAGGGMYNYQKSSPTLTSVTFSGNKAHAGGGMFNDNASNPTLTSVTFSVNKANAGGGMYNWSSSPSITNVTFNRNEVTADGGGMFNYNSSPSLMNVEFSDNTASYGGVLYNINSSPTLTNVTISGNQSMGTKGAIFGGNSQSKIQNSIIVGNHNEPALSNYTGAIANSLLDVEENGTVLAKLHNTKSDVETDTYKLEALFIDPSQSDYRLRANSPAINKGNNSDNTILTDLSGNPRIQGVKIDLGAYEAFTYMVTYQENGATGGDVPVDKETYDQGHSVIVQSNSGKLEREGYTFKGWNTQVDGKGTHYAENSTFLMSTANVMLYAEWTGNPTYTVQYDANGATGGQVPQDNAEYEENEMVTVQSNSGKLVKTGYTFKGWNTQADGKGTPFTENATFPMSKGNVTLYAEWTKNLTYTATYDANGATGGQVPQDKNEYEEREMVTVQSNSGKLVRTGYTFKGWNTQADGKGIFYMENVTFRMGKTNITLYAQWTVNSPTTGGSTTSPPASNDNDFYPPTTVKITLDTNGGTTLAPIEIAYNTKVSDLPVPTRVGFRFDGWYQDAVLTTKWAGNKLIREDLTLYAKWTVLPVEESKGSEEPKEPQQPQQQKPFMVTFQDIENHWAREMIEALATQGIIKGYEDGTFRPNEPISRQHVVALFTQAFEFETIRPATVFSDVAQNHIYYDEIMTMQRAGIIDGTNGTFAPAAYLTRAQLAKVLVGTLQLTPKGSSSFKDVSSSHWSVGYIAALERKGIALGDNGYFRPEAPVTRAQLAAFLYRAMQQETSEF